MRCLFVGREEGGRAAVRWSQVLGTERADGCFDFISRFEF